jgi:hypothetical protein
MICVTASGVDPLLGFAVADGRQSNGKIKNQKSNKNINKNDYFSQ